MGSVDELYWIGGVLWMQEELIKIEQALEADSDPRKVCTRNVVENPSCREWKDR